MPPLCFRELACGGGRRQPGQQAGLRESGGKPPHSKAAQSTLTPPWLRTDPSITIPLSGDGLPSPAFPLVTTRVGQALPLRRAGSKTNERSGNVDENKGQPTREPQCLDKASRAAAFAFSFSPHKISVKKPSPWGEDGPRRRVRAAGGPGDGLVTFPIDILSLILLIAARILSRLSVPPQSRRG